MNMNQKSFANIILVIVVVAIVVVGGYFFIVKKSEPTAQQPTPTPSSNVQTPTPTTSQQPTPTPSSNVQTPTPTTSQQPTPTQPQLNLNIIFGLSSKEAGTKIYYSEKLGVGFTYLEAIYFKGADVTVTEIGSKIYVHLSNENPEEGKSIEVFTKDPDISFHKAIENKFLVGIDPKDCFVSTNDVREPKLLNYISAEISFPYSTDPNGWWGLNSDRCPEYYSETKGVQYFLMNNDVAGKFLFVKLGQDVIASDGTPWPEEWGGVDWSDSIQILK